MTHDMGGASSRGMLAARTPGCLAERSAAGPGERTDAFRVLRSVAGRLAAPQRLPMAPPTTPIRHEGSAGLSASAEDSGSLLLDRDDRPVGLLFACSDEVSVASPIGLVESLLQVRVGL